VTREDNLEAQRLLEQAIAIDGNYAQALAVFAVSHMFGTQMGWEVAATAVPIAERAAMAALRADGEDPWAHFALGCVHPYRGRMADALEAYETALRLNPNFSAAQGYYGLVLSWNGRSEEGAEAARRAIRLSPRDPLSPTYYGVAAYAAYVARDYTEAIALAHHAVRQRSDFVGGLRVLVAAAGMAGEMELARTALQELRRALPSSSLAWVASNLPLRGEEQEHFLEGLRRAGLE
jgi:tetratricopeptide (TPR) repeat protein